MYYALVVVPQQNAVQAQEAAAQAQAQAAENKIQLQTCLQGAAIGYSAAWAQACTTNAQRVSSGYQDCLSTVQDVSMCRSVWGTPDSSPNCGLPSAAAQYVNANYASAKSDCYRQYPQ